MTGQKTFDPYETWKSFMFQWEKQANDMIHLWTNNRDFVKFSNAGSELQTRYLERIQKNQELVANQLNLLTKSDLANVAKLTIQTEEKLDALEEQMWNLQDSIESSSKEFTEESQEIIKQIKQLKSEQLKNKKELEAVREIGSELYEMKRELAEMNSLKEEIISLKALLAEKNAKHEHELTVISK